MSMFDTLMATAVVAFALFAGWVMAHIAVAQECEKLGGFYVGTNVYECRPKGEKP